jgi:hypothetical protein
MFNFLTKYCTSRVGGLAEGAPASTYLFNVYAENMLDEKIRSICVMQGITYTRLGDDLAFSSKRPFDDEMRRSILNVLREAKMPINFRKTKLYDLKKDGSMQLNGIGIRNVPNQRHSLGGRLRGELFLPRHYRRKIKGLLHTALHSDKKISPNKIFGTMGVFFSSTSDSYHWSNEDAKIFKMYRKLFSRGIKAKHASYRDLDLPF